MENDKQSNEKNHIVVVNHEEQYSIWQTDREIPLGWEQVGEPETREACLSHIEEVWTDMRPLSLRKEMAKQVSN